MDALSILQIVTQRFFDPIYYDLGCVLPIKHLVTIGFEPPVVSTVLPAEVPRLPSDWHNTLSHAHLYLVAHVLQPLHDGPLFHRRRERRHVDLDRLPLPPQQPGKPRK